MTSSTSRMLNSELARKLKARHAASSSAATPTRKGKSKNDDDDPTERLLHGPRSDHPIEGTLHSLLAPLHSVVMACQSPDVDVFRKDVVSPSGMNYFPARNPRDVRRDDRGCSSPSSLSSMTEVPSETSLATCAPSSVVRAGSTSTTDGSEGDWRLRPPPPRFPSPSDDRPSPPRQTSTYNYFEPERNADRIDEPSSPADGSHGYPASDSSSLLTCAPSTVVMAMSTSATCPSVTPPRGHSHPHGAVLHPTRRHRRECGHRDRDEPPQRQPRRNPSKNLLRLLYDRDECHPVDRRNRSHRTAAPAPWLLSPFPKTKRNTDKSIVKKKRRPEEGEAPASPPSTRRAPVDLDDVSSDSHRGQRHLMDDDTEAGYYSEPTEAPPRPVVPPPSRKIFDRERVLSQLGMDVREEDYCLEGEYGYGRSSDPRLTHGRSCGGGGGGRWNYHQRKPSYVYDTGPRLDVGEVIVADGAELDGQQTTQPSPQQRERRRPGSELGENIKEGMKKMNSRARQTLGNIISKSSDDDDDDDESEGERGGSGRTKQRPGDTPNSKVFGSKVLSLLRGHHHRSNTSDVPPQIITVTPTTSEDPEMPMTNEEWALMQRWQMARAKCRNDTRGTFTARRDRVVSPDVRGRGDPSAKHDGGEVSSIGASSWSDRTEHADNRLRQCSDGGRGDSMSLSESSF